VSGLASTPTGYSIGGISYDTITFGNGVGDSVFGPRGGSDNTITLGNGNDDTVTTGFSGGGVFATDNNTIILGNSGSVDTFIVGNGTGDTVTISGGAGGNAVTVASNDEILTDTSGGNADILKGTGTGDVFSDGHGDAALKLITTGGNATFNVGLVNSETVALHGTADNVINVASTAGNVLIIKGGVATDALTFAGAFANATITPYDNAAGKQIGDTLTFADTGQVVNVVGIHVAAFSDGRAARDLVPTAKGTARPGSNTAHPRAGHQGAQWCERPDDPAWRPAGSFNSALVGLLLPLFLLWAQHSHQVGFSDRQFGQWPSGFVLPWQGSATDIERVLARETPGAVDVAGVAQAAGPPPTAVLMGPDQVAVGHHTNSPASM